MAKIFKYLKPYAVLILLCAVLLFTQAMCDLRLPDLMSRIVNVGILSGGVEEPVYEAVTSDTMSIVEKTYKFLGEKEEYDNILSVYERVTFEDARDDIKAKYPVIESQDIFLGLPAPGGGDTMKPASLSIAKAVMIYSQLSAVMDMVELDSTSSYMTRISPAFEFFITEQSGSDESWKAIRLLYSRTDADGWYIPYILPITIPTLTDVFKELRSGIKGVVDGYMAIMGDFMEQGAIKLIFEENKSLGMDTDKIQNLYVLMTGLNMLGVALVSATCVIIVGYFAARIATGVGRDMRKLIFYKVNKFSEYEFDKFSTASLITRSTNDVMQIQGLLVMAIRMLIYAPIMGVGAVINAWNKSSDMSWILAVIVGALILMIATVASIVIPRFKKMQKLIDNVNLVTREQLTGMMVIRAFNKQKYEKKRFEKVNADLTANIMFVNKVFAVMTPFMTIALSVVCVFIIWIGADWVAAGRIMPGDMMAFMNYAMQVIFSFVMVSVMFIMVPRALVSAARIDEVLSTEISVKDKPDAVSIPLPVKGEVSYNNVSFKYPKAIDNVLTDISFTVSPSKVLGIIGSTGSGKSTVVKLLPRFYDVSGGSITIDGVDIRDITLKELRDNIAYIPQKNTLFMGDIANNIELTERDFDPDKGEWAAEIAQIKPFVDEKEERFNYLIAQGGDNVSGGQKQRLSIARAVYKNAPVYVFDDSFSALDFKTDSLLRKAIREKLSDKGIIIIAQRVGTIMDADEIIVLDEGRIVGKGRHKELLRTCPEYQEIALSQLSKEELQYE